MENRDKKTDELPESFATGEEVSEFWDSHSAADYTEFFEPADDGFDITGRVYEVQVSEEVFNGLRKSGVDPSIGPDDGRSNAAKRTFACGVTPNPAISTLRQFHPLTLRG